MHRFAVCYGVVLLGLNPLLAADETPNPPTNSIGMEFVEIQHTPPFALGKTEVTQSQFKKVLGTTPWVDKESVETGDDNPAVYVIWNDAMAFCRKLTETDHKSGQLPAGELYRLPTEAEWEFACRAGTTTPFAFGAEEAQLDEYGWFSGNVKEEKWAHAVGTKKPNLWGLYDMHGNVWEWCSDWSPAGRGRVYRGGSWMHGASGCQSTSRYDYGPSSRTSNVGFRVARSQSLK